ncbi:MAG: YbfB/YjiJ family MFS transporter [Rhodospirillales bacterium]|nr:YbfB/YjiJ family MFS transporter [Rhodospirillales bacterium]
MAIAPAAQPPTPVPRAAAAPRSAPSGDPHGAPPRERHSPPPAAPSTPPAAVGIALAGMAALASGMGIGRFVYTPILPAMAEGLGLASTSAGLIASANFVGYLAGALLAATPLPGARRTWFLGALAVGALSTILMGMVGTMPAFLALRCVGGVASAIVLVIGSVLVLDALAAVGRSRLAPLHFAGVGVGIVVSALVVSGLEAAGQGWRALWIGAGVAAALAVPVAVWGLPAREAAAPPVPSGGAPGGVRRGPVAALAVCHGLFGFGYIVTATFLVAVVRASPGARAFEALVWPVVGLAAALSVLLWGRLGARIGVLPLYGAACLVEAVGVAVGGFWPTPAGALLSALLLGGTFMGITALGFSAARALAPGEERRVSALITAAFGLGQIVGPVLAGWLLDRAGGFALPSGIAAGALVVGGIMALGTARAVR